MGHISHSLKTAAKYTVPFLDNGFINVSTLKTNKKKVAGHSASLFMLCTTPSLITAGTCPLLLPLTIIGGSIAFFIIHVSEKTFSHCRKFRVSFNDCMKNHHPKKTSISYLVNRYPNKTIDLLHKKNKIHILNHRSKNGMSFLEAAQCKKTISNLIQAGADPFYLPRHHLADIEKAIMDKDLYRIRLYTQNRVISNNQAVWMMNLINSKKTLIFLIDEIGINPNIKNDAGYSIFETWLDNSAIKPAYFKILTEKGASTEQITKILQDYLTCYPQETIDPSWTFKDWKRYSKNEAKRARYAQILYEILHTNGDTVESNPSVHPPKTEC